MSKVTCDLTISVDGYVAGPDQRPDQPLGANGERLHRWMFEEADRHAESLEKITAAGAFVMGRNMFASGRGDWDPNWTGWWGDEPPYHAPVFVLTHYPRETITMRGGTTFSFVTDGIESALARARRAADGRDVAICGGAQTVNQYLAAGHIDELRLHIAPMVLGAGERLFTGVGDIGLEPVAVSGTSLVTHVTYRIPDPPHPVNRPG
ncbi:MAG TPA: dihydrofolate reductase family protein [Spirillospora sp.]